MNGTLSGIFRACCALVLGGSMVACGSGAQDRDGVAAVAGAGTAAAVATGAAGRPYVGKPRPPVRVSLDEKSVLQPGVPGSLTLRVQAGIPVTGVHLAVDTASDPGLVVTGLAQQVDALPGPEARFDSAGLEFLVPATAVSGGFRQLTGVVHFEVAGVAQAAPFSVAVRVPGPVTVQPSYARPERPVTPDATGELVDSMTAETMIR